MVADTLTALSHARADATTVRVLPEEMQRAAYGAWSISRDDILASWRRGEDPRNLQPPVPKTMRDAAALLRRTPPPAGMSQAAVDEATDAIEAPYGARILGMVREAMANGQTDSERAMSVLTLVENWVCAQLPPRNHCQ